MGICCLQLCAIVRATLGNNMSIITTITTATIILAVMLVFISVITITTVTTILIYSYDCYDYVLSGHSAGPMAA